MKIKLPFKKKVLSSVEKVERAKKKVSSALNAFTTMYKDLQEANETLENVIKEDKELVAKTQDNIEIASLELDSNKALQEKIKVFIKE